MIITILALNIKAVLIAAAVVAGTALLIGAMLGVAGKFFQVEVDEKEVKVREMLPGNNCGGCGYAGCDTLAKEIVAGNAPANACPVARANHGLIADIIGAQVEAAERKVAYVHCKGTCDKTTIKYHYDGLADCKKLALIPGHGEKLCAFGCMGYGSCVRVCQDDAIKIVNGVAVVDKEKCIGCARCVKECPNHLIELIPYDTKYAVSCNSNAKGKDVKVACEVGCIGCGICAKVCEFGAITLENNLARIDASKCTGCGKCAEKCPSKIIYKIS